MGNKNLWEVFVKLTQLSILCTLLDIKVYITAVKYIEDADIKSKMINDAVKSIEELAKAFGNKDLEII